MSETPTVTVVIPAYNAERFVSRAVRSVLTQTRPALEVIVIDDGSTDGTSEVLASEFGARVQLLRQPNAGVSAARNAGIGQASGDVVAFLDADDEWLPHKLERQAALLHADPGLALVHCGVEDIDEAGTSLELHLDGMAGWVVGELVRLRRPVILGGGSGIVVRRRVLGELRGFDRDLSTSADWDLFVRTAARYRVGFAPEVLLRYRRHGTNMSGDVGLMQRDMTRALHKAFSSGDAPRELRRPAFARLHVILAGSYFAVGQRQKAAAHLARAALLAPPQAGSVLQAATRRLRRPAAGRRRSAG